MRTSGISVPLRSDDSFSPSMCLTSVMEWYFQIREVRLYALEGDLRGPTALRSAHSKKWGFMLWVDEMGSFSPWKRRSVQQWFGPGEGMGVKRGGEAQ